MPSELPFLVSSRSLPRCSEFAFKELSQAARVYVEVLGDFPYNGMRHAFELEKLLAKAGHEIIELTDELRGFPRGWPLAVNRYLEDLAALVRRQFERWGWSIYLTNQGRSFVEVGLFNHRQQREIPFLRANLTWRQCPGVAHHRLADDLADYALTLGLAPVEVLGCDEAAERTDQLHREWHTGAALADKLPDPTQEESIAADRAASAIRHYAEQLITPPELQLMAEESQAQHPRAEPDPTKRPIPPTPAEVLPVLDAMIVGATELLEAKSLPGAIWPTVASKVWPTFQALYRLCTWDQNRPSEPPASVWVSHLWKLTGEVAPAGPEIYNIQWVDECLRLLQTFKYVRDRLREEIPEEPSAGAIDRPSSGRGEGSGEAGAGGPRSHEDDPKIAPSRLKAFQQFQDALRRWPELEGAQDKEVYDRIEAALEDGESLPSFATWSAYVRAVRPIVGKSKYSARRGRTGRNIVRRNDA